MRMRQGALTPFQCQHAGDTDLRPHCEGFAVVAYGGVALCARCDAMRSAVGREHAGRPFPGAGLDHLARAADAVNVAEQALADAVRSAHRSGASWSQIGNIVGTTRQAAHQRWASREDADR